MSVSSSHSLNSATDSNKKSEMGASILSPLLELVNVHRGKSTAFHQSRLLLKALKEHKCTIPYSMILSSIKLVRYSMIMW